MFCRIEKMLKTSWTHSEIKVKLNFGAYLFSMVNDFVIPRRLSWKKLLKSFPVCALARTMALSHGLAPPTICNLGVKGRNKLSSHSKGHLSVCLVCDTATALSILECWIIFWVNCCVLRTKFVRTTRTWWCFETMLLLGSSSYLMEAGRNTGRTGN